jgi:hypothetical protein
MIDAVIRRPLEDRRAGKSRGHHTTSAVGLPTDNGELGLRYIDECKTHSRFVPIGSRRPN